MEYKNKITNIITFAALIIMLFVGIFFMTKISDLKVEADTIEATVTKSWRSQKFKRQRSYKMNIEWYDLEGNICKAGNRHNPNRLSAGDTVQIKVDKATHSRIILSMSGVIVMFIMGVFISVLSIVLAVIKYKRLTRKKRVRLIEYLCNYGGDMQGGHKRIQVTRIDEVRAYVSVSKADWHNEEPEVKDYYVSNSLIDSISDVYYTYKLGRLKHLPMNPVFACDAGNFTYCFRFEDGTSLCFDTTKLIPQRGYDAVNKIYGLIEEAVKEKI